MACAQPEGVPATACVSAETSPGAGPSASRPGPAQEARGFVAEEPPAGTHPRESLRDPGPLAPGPPVMALRISRAASSRISMDACSLYQAACGVQIRLGASFRGPWLKLGQKAQSGHGLGAHPTVRPSGSPGPSQLPVD